MNSGGILSAATRDQAMRDLFDPVNGIGVGFIRYVSVSNEPTCCGTDATGYASMNWNGSGLLEFTKNHLLPAFRAAGITTKVLILDYNWGNYNDLGSVPLAEAALQRPPLRRDRLARLRRERHSTNDGAQPIPGRQPLHDRAFRGYLDRQPAARRHAQSHRLHP